MIPVKVLIVESCAADAGELEAALKTLGYVVTGTLLDEEDALARARETKADLVLMDVTQKNDVAALLQQELHIPVIYLTAHEDPLTIARASDAYGYLVKPVSAPALHAGIQLALYKQRSEKQQRQNNMHLRLLEENSRDIVFRLEMQPQAHFSYVSPAATSILGYATEEFYRDARLFQKIVIPEDLELLTQAFQNPQQWDAARLIRYRHKDWQTVWVEQQHTAVYGADDRLIAIEGVLRDVSKQVQAQQEDYRLFQESPQGAAVIQDMRIVYANPALAKHMQIPLEELVGKPLSELIVHIHPDDRPGLLRFADKWRLNENPLNRHAFRFIDPKGAARWVEVFYMATQYQGERAVRATYIDITARKEAESRLQRHMEFVRVLQEIASGLIAQKDTSVLLRKLVKLAAEQVQAPSAYICTLDEANQKMVYRVGVGMPAALIGHLFSISDESIAAQAWRNAQAIIIDDYAMQASRFAGMDVHAYTTLPIFAQNKRVIGVLGVAYEDSQRRFGGVEMAILNRLAQFTSIVLEYARLNNVLKSEAQHRINAEEFLDKILTSAPLRISIFDVRKKQIIYANRTNYYEGIPLEEFNNLTVEEGLSYIHEDDRQRYLAFLENLITLQDGEQRNIEIRLVDTEKPHWVRNSYLVFERDKDRIPAQILILSEDISARKVLEEQLLYVEKMTTLCTLTAGIAHELNTPLQIITGDSESLKRDLQAGLSSSESVEKRIERIYRNGWRIAEIVSSLTNFIRPEGDPIELADLNDLIREAVALLEARLAGSPSVQLTMELEPGIPALLCHCAAVVQVIQHLVANALDAVGREGAVRIITTHNAPEQSVLLRVSNNGPAVPQEIRSKIFDPFFSTQPVGMSKGLGLWIVAGTVRSHGGDIHLESDAEQGTTFIVSFPVPQGQNSTPSPQGLGRFCSNTP